MANVVFENENKSFLKIVYPCRMLVNVVEYYFEVRQPSHAPTFITGLPSLNTLLAIQLRGKGRSINESNGRSISLSSISLLGHNSVPFTGVYEDSLVFYIKFKASSGPALFSIPSRELLNQQIEISNFLKGFPTAQFESLLSFQDRVAFMEQHLLKMMQRVAYTYKREYVKSFLVEFSSMRYEGNHSLSSLCKKYHVTYASLRRYFIDELGVSPKFCQKIGRFKRALRAYKIHGYSFHHSDFGYTDFSHFCKDSRELTRKPPLEL
jgi:hypothetical protein